MTDRMQRGEAAAGATVDHAVLQLMIFYRSATQPTGGSLPARDVDPRGSGNPGQLTFSDQPTRHPTQRRFCQSQLQRRCLRCESDARVAARDAQLELQRRTRLLMPQRGPDWATTDPPLGSLLCIPAAVQTNARTTARQRSLQRAAAASAVLNVVQHAHPTSASSLRSVARCSMCIRCSSCMVSSIPSARLTS